MRGYYGVLAMEEKSMGEPVPDVSLALSLALKPLIEDALP